MRVAMLSPIAWRTPPRHYGPWERVVSLLTEALVRKGVDVTLFATADSETTGKLHAVAPRPYEEDKNLVPVVRGRLHHHLRVAPVDKIRRIGNPDGPWQDLRVRPIQSGKSVAEFFREQAHVAAICLGDERNAFDGSKVLGLRQANSDAMSRIRAVGKVIGVS